MSHVSSGAGRPLPMTVDKVGFLLDRLGRTVRHSRYLRELTQNAIESIQRTGEPGQITWDVDWTLYDCGLPMKLCVIDTGDGMTGGEMIRFINQLSSSGSKQSIIGNFGVGAKIAAATRNSARSSLPVVEEWRWFYGLSGEEFCDRRVRASPMGIRKWDVFLLPSAGGFRQANGNQAARDESHPIWREIDRHNDLCATWRRIAFAVDLKIPQYTVFSVPDRTDGQGA